MAHCFDDVKTESDRVFVANWEEYDLQLLMKESMLMLTDYTSAVMDFAYMQKPVLYYQFDYDKYRNEHFKEGYFNYERDGFGKVVYDEKSLLTELESLVKTPVMTEEYKARLESFFPLRDKNNCERIYEAIKNI